MRELGWSDGRVSLTAKELYVASLAAPYPQHQVARRDRSSCLPPQHQGTRAACAKGPERNQGKSDLLATGIAHILVLI